MATKKSGRELVDKLYRDLERIYPIKIERGEIDDLAQGGLPVKLYSQLQSGVEALEKTIARLPKPDRPQKHHLLKSKGNIPKA